MLVCGFIKVFIVPSTSLFLSHLTSNMDRWHTKVDADWLKKNPKKKTYNTEKRHQSLVMNCIQIHPPHSFHLIERNQVDYECLCSSVSLYAVDQRAGTVAWWSGQGKWKMRAGGTEPTIKTFSCEEEPGIAALGIWESSLLFLKALRWLRLTLHGTTPVQMLRVVRGAAGLSQTLSPFITKLLLVTW